MRLDEAQKILEAEIIVEANLQDIEVEMCCGADLMSDVLALGKPGALLLTGLTNAQVVRTADVADLRAICIVRGKKPDQETVKMAKSRNLPLLMTRLPMFEACGRLHREGLLGCLEREQ